MTIYTVRKWQVDPDGYPSEELMAVEVDLGFAIELAEAALAGFKCANKDKLAADKQKYKDGKYFRYRGRLSRIYLPDQEFDTSTNASLDEGPYWQITAWESHQLEVKSLGAKHQAVNKTGSERSQVPRTVRATS